MEKSGPRIRADRKKQEALLSLLRQVRREKRLRQEDVAVSLGCPQSLISKYESGERRLDLLELHNLCAVLGLSLVEFVRRFEKAVRES